MTLPVRALSTRSVALSLAVGALAVLPATGQAAMSGTCRVDAATLTVAERQAYVDAVNAVMNDGDYMPFVDQHDGAMFAGHMGPGFLPWHREFLRRFEERLREENPNISIPYWDWSSTNTAGGESLIWRTDFMGLPGASGTGVVNTGPFASWGILRRDFNPFEAPAAAGRDDALLALTGYGDFNSQLEMNPHNETHDWVGGADLDGLGLEGTMATMRSPHDPIFWLMHSNVDRLWAEWVDQHQWDDGFDPYPFTSGQKIGHNLNDTMWPWDGSSNSQGGETEPWATTPELVRPSDILDHTTQGYRYDTIDTECGGTPTPPPPPPPHPPAPTPPPTTPPTTPPTPPTTTPTVRPQPRAIRFAMSRRPSRGTTTKVVVRGLIAPAVGQRCGGAMLIRAYVGKRKFAAAKVRLRKVSGRCRFVAVIPTKRAKRARVIRVTARFTGTSKTRPKSSRAKAFRIRPPAPVTS